MSRYSEKTIDVQIQNALTHLDDLTKFNISKLNTKPYPGGRTSLKSINGATNILEFTNGIDQILNRIKEILNKTLQLKNSYKRLKYIEEVQAKIKELEFEEEKVKPLIKGAKVNLQKKIDQGDFDHEGEISDYIFSDWQQFLGEAADEYLKIPQNLNNIIQIIIEKGDYIISPDGKISPLDPKSLPKRWFSSNLTGKEFAHFVQLCIEAKIIKPIPGDKKKNSSRKDVARMIAENFQNQQSKRFSAGSFYDDMKKSPGDFTKKEVKGYIKKMIQ